MDPTAIDPTRCPLCRKDNACGGAAGQPKCWCWDETIPATMIAKLPPEARDQACVCQGCVHAKEKSVSLLQQLRKPQQR